MGRHEVVGKPRIFEAATREEGVLDQFLYEIAHCARERISLFLCLQRCAVLEAEKQIPDLFIIGFIDDDNIEGVGVEI